MKNQIRPVLAPFLAVLLLVPVGLTRAQGPDPSTATLSVAGTTALGSAITYQGYLTDGGAPANGVYDMTDRLFSSATDSNQVGPAIEVPDVTVSSGRFAVRLRFRNRSFNGLARWLQIQVRPGASTRAYTPIPPRQELTAETYALNSLTIADRAVTPAKIANGAVRTSKIAPNAVTSDQIVDGSIGALDLGPDAVTGDFIADGTVGNLDLTPGAVTGDKIADGAISSSKVVLTMFAAAPLASPISLPSSADERQVLALDLTAGFSTTYLVFATVTTSSGQTARGLSRLSDRLFA